MKFFYKEKLDSQSGATAILTTVLIMSAVLSLSLLLTGAVIKNLKLSFNFSDSVRAFYAADAAIEKCVYQARKTAGNCMNIDGTTSVSLDNGASAEATRVSATIIEAIGSLGSTNRKIKAEGDFASVMVSSIDPSVGVTDSTVSSVSVSGSGFENGATVKLSQNGTEILPSTAFTYVDDTSLTGGAFDLTGAELGDWDVIVQNPSGQNGILENGFTVTDVPPPGVSSISPSSGNIDTVVSGITVSGANFESGATVKLINGALTINPSTAFTFSSSTSLTNGAFDLTGAELGDWDVVVTNPDGKTGTLNNGFTVTDLPPVTLSGVLAGLYDYTGRDVIIENVDVIDYNGSGDTGYFEVRGKTITVNGTINADYAGYNGGNGGSGGTWSSGSGGSSGGGPFGGAGGSGGAGGGWDRYFSGVAGSSGYRGGYRGSQVNGDSSTDESVYRGSGGGGGGGGGASSRYGANNNYPAGGGGGGGGGGRGGGMVKLIAQNTLTMNGYIYTRGASSGNRGSDSPAQPDSCDRFSYNNPGGGGGSGSAAGNGGGGSGSYGGRCAGGCTCLYGSSGGSGNAGAGGGVLLKGNQIIIQGNATIDARGGGNNTVNGGTVKLFYQQGNPSTSKIYAGRVYKATY